MTDKATIHLTEQEQRLKDALHYIISVANTNNLSINLTILLKIIFFAEYLFFQHEEKLITGVNFVKAPFGPVPDGYKNILNILERENKINFQELQSLIEPNRSLLSPEGLQKLEEVTIDLCSNSTAKKLSNITHAGYVWQVAEMGKIIPIIDYLGSPSRPITNNDITKAIKWVIEFNLPDSLDAI